MSRADVTAELSRTMALNVLANAVQDEDTAHTSGDKGLVLLAVRKDTAAALATTDGDYIPLTVDSTGRLRIAPLPAASGVDIGDVDVASIVPTDRRAIPSVAGDIHLPDSNTAAVVTYAAGAAGTKHYLYSVGWSYNATPTGGNIKIDDVSGTTVFSHDIVAAGPGQWQFDPPMVSSAAVTAMIVTLAAGGAGVTGKLSCRHEVK